MAATRFQVVNRVDGLHWRLVGGNGELLAEGVNDGFASRETLMRSLSLIRAAVLDAVVYGPNGQVWYRPVTIPPNEGLVPIEPEGDPEIEDSTVDESWGQGNP